MFNILTLNKISPAGLSQLDPAKYAYDTEMKNPDAIMVRSAKMHDMELDDTVLAIARAGAGTNNIPIDRCTESGIVVFNTPGANSNAVKELVICGLLLASRKVVAGIEWEQSLKGNGDEVGKMVEKGKSAYKGPEILGKTLGVVGLGAIGMKVAKAAEALGMTVLGYDPFLKDANGIDVTDNLDDIYAKADYIALHLPQNDETKGMVNADTIAKMKDGVRIVNFARGGLVKSDDLVAALEAGKVAAYVTDFADDTLLGVENVVAIPHLGASTPESEDNCAEMAANELVAYLEDGNIINSVNLPNIVKERAGTDRLTVIAKNDDAVIDAVKATVPGDTEVATRGDVAYLIIDADGVDEAKAAAIDGVLRARKV